MNEPLVWSMSLEHGEFRVECPFPLSDHDLADLAEFLNIINRQISRGTVIESRTQATS
jgi:hypothetical protein